MHTPPQSSIPHGMATQYFRFVCMCCLILLLAACGQGPAPETPIIEEAETSELELLSTKTFGLRGNTSFSESQLTTTERLWYGRLWASIRHSSPATNYASQARSGNLFNYARSLNTYITSLLAVFRVTGDLRLLDEIDRHMQLMRGQLRTTWVDKYGNSVTPNDGTRGLRRWLYLKGSGSTYGKDTHVMDSVMTHAMVANIAYAYEMNRGVRSPAGINYGERADFWKNYLKNDFERIWRIRVGSKWPMWNHQVSHSYRSNIRWHYYMGRLFGESKYRDTAVSLANTAIRNEREVSTSYGTARVWSHRLLDQSFGLQPMAYAAYDWSIWTDLALDGFSPVTQSGYMRKHATTLASYVMDGSTSSFSFDVGGMRDRGGIPTRNPWDTSGLKYAREDIYKFSSNPFTLLSAFDGSGRVRSISEQVYKNLESDQSRPKRPFLPAGIVFSSIYSRR